MQLLLAPLSIMELLSQLGTDDANEAFAAIQALPRVHDPVETGVLPWSDDLFRIALFKLPPGEDTMTPALNKAVIAALNAPTADALRDEGKETRALLDTSKAEATANFAALLNAWRTEGPLSEADHQAIFARSIARRAGLDEADVNVELVVDALNAHYIFEKSRIETAVKHRDYNVEKRANDVYDAELLISLADPTLHLLTSDAGFHRAENSTQANRIHIVAPKHLMDAKSATQTIRAMVESAAG